MKQKEEDGYAKDNDDYYNRDRELGEMRAISEMHTSLFRHVLLLLLLLLFFPSSL